MDITSSMKNENHNVTLSNIITRADHLGGHSIITFAFRGEGGPQNANKSKQGGGGFLPSRRFAKKKFFY